MKNAINKKGGAFKTGVWVKRVIPHESGEESGYLTYGKSYQVMSPDYFNNSKNIHNSYNGKLAEDVGILAPDCVMIRDDKGKIGIFGAKNFKVTSK